MSKNLCPLKPLVAFSLSTGSLDDAQASVDQSRRYIRFSNQILDTTLYKFSDVNTICTSSIESQWVLTADDHYGLFIAPFDSNRASGPPHASLSGWGLADTVGCIYKDQLLLVEEGAEFKLVLYNIQLKSLEKNRLTPGSVSVVWERLLEKNTSDWGGERPHVSLQMNHIYATVLHKNPTTESTLLTVLSKENGRLIYSADTSIGWGMGFSSVQFISAHELLIVFDCDEEIHVPIQIWKMSEPVQIYSNKLLVKKNPDLLVKSSPGLLFAKVAQGILYFLQSTPIELVKTDDNDGDDDGDDDTGNDRTRSHKEELCRVVAVDLWRPHAPVFGGMFKYTKSSAGQHPDKFVICGSSLDTLFYGEIE